MIAVLVAAASSVTRAGLKAIVEEAPECIVAGSADAQELVERALDLRPAIVLWQLAPEEDAAATLQALGDLPVVLLTDQAATDLVRAGARGVLPWSTSGEQIAVALRAASLDLVVMTPQSREPVEKAPEKVSTILTARETEVLRMIGEGLANKEIAYRLGISEHTVKFHVSALLGKLGASTRAEAIRVGIRQGAILL